MLPQKKVSWWKFVKFCIHLILLAPIDAEKTRESIYSVFKVPTIPLHPENLVRNFGPKDRANVQVDLFIGSETTDSKLVNLIVRDCSKESTLVVSSLSKVRNYVSSSRNGSVGSKLKDLILVYDSVVSIDLDALKTWFENRWNTRARVIAYVEKVDNNTPTEILAYFWKHDLLNVALMVQSQTSKVTENFIYNPFVSAEIPSGSRRTLEKLNSDDLMFPDKLTNLQNYTIPISQFAHYPQVTTIDNCTSLDKGADIEVLRVLSKKLNFNVDLKSANVFGPSYTVQLPNGKQVGVIGDVLVNRSDIVLNVQPMVSTIGNRVEFTYPMLQTRYCVMVPKAKVMPMILRTVLPLPKKIWLAIMIVLGILFVCLTLMGEKNKFLKIFKVLLFQNFGNISKRTVNRIIAITYILWAYLMICIYQGNFIKELLLPRYYKDLDTLEELYESELPLYVNENMARVLNNSDIPIFTKLENRIVDNLVLNQCRDQLSQFLNISCVADEDLSILLVNKYIKNNNTFLLHMVKECLAIDWDVYIVKDGFPFLEKFNQIIQSILESGLYKKWIVDITSTTNRPNIEEPRTGKLTMTHCEGAIGSFFIGVGISILVFILEFVTFHFSIKMANNISRVIWNIKKLKHDFCQNFNI